MNDRFKFRVWDKVSKRYFYLELKFGDNGYHPSFITDPVFEQCTGFSDKNGNLIYEGDIIKCGNTTGIVKFGLYRRTDEHFPDSIYGFYIEWEKQCIFRQDFGYWATEERIEIIGNIHEIKGE